MVIASWKYSWSKINFQKIARKRLPILTWLPQYTIAKLLQDLLAGFTVGITEIPQALSYAVLAGLSPEYGLYSGLLDGFIYAIFGGCKSLNIGPSSALTLIIAPHVANWGADASILFTFFSGVIIIVCAILQLGIVTDFLSYPVISGFLTSGIVLIGSSQLVKMLQIPGSTRTFPDTCTTIYNNIAQTSKWDATLGLTSFVVLFVIKKLGNFGQLHYEPSWSRSRNFWSRCVFFLSLSRSALAVIVGMVLSFVWKDEAPFAITGTIDGHYPTFRLPPFSSPSHSFGEFAQSCGVSFIIIPLIAMLETVSVVKTIARNQQFDSSQEMWTLGLCNLCGSFIGSMPVAGSFTRSVLNCASNVQTTLAGAFTSILLLLTIAFLTPTFYYIPKATLAAVLIHAILPLFDYKVPVLLWNTKKLDLIPYIASIIMCLTLGVDYGILVGLAVHVLFLLYATARPKLLVVPDVDKNVVVITPKDDLLFPAGEHLRQTAFDLGTERGVVINGKYLRSMDVSVAKSLSVLAKNLVSNNRKIVFVDFKKSLFDMCVMVDRKMENYFVDDYDKIDDFQEEKITCTVAN